MKINISLSQVEKQAHFWRTSVGMLDVFHDYLVELTSIDHPEITNVVIVQGRTNEEAVYNAFWTRNIASSWIVTEVEQAE